MLAHVTETEFPVGIVLFVLEALAIGGALSLYYARRSSEVKRLLARFRSDTQSGRRD
ncbi:MAG: hypothetical protein R3B96_22645 [Pirellulaceae bacterium]